MSRSLPALLLLLALVATPGCSLSGASCDDDSLECYCEQNPENCRDSPEARAAAQDAPPS